MPKTPAAIRTTGHLNQTIFIIRISGQNDLYKFRLRLE